MTDRPYDFLFRADLFRASMRCMSTEETRYYLNGVAVQPHPSEGVFLVATDDHRMSVMHDPQGYASRSAIFRPTLKPAEYKPGPREGDLFVTATLNPGADGFAAYGLASSVLREYPSDGRNPLTFDYLPDEIDPESTGWESTARKLNVLEEIDGSFPDWTRVLPNCWGQESGPVLFNAKYVTELAEARKDFQRTVDRAGQECTRYPAMRVTGNGSGPALIQFPGAPFAVFCIMPIRDANDLARPNWLNGTAPDPVETTETESVAAQ